MLSSLKHRSSHEQQLELLSHAEDQTLPEHVVRTSRDDDEKEADVSTKSANRVGCLDGLRGLACIAVFNYHFLWPWTAAVMLGHGAVTTRSPEPYNNLFSLPILCLLHRGRPMVAIFFAISGYVLCRHVIQAIQEHDFEAVRRKLSSAVFRRIFRLYIPPTISMLLVAILAQLGAFPSEALVYQGPGSAYINGSLINAAYYKPCPKESTAVIGIDGVRDYFGVQTSTYLGGSITATERLCLDRLSQIASPVAMYEVIAQDKARLSVRTDASSTRDTSPKRYWIEYGGSWEEHPIIFEDITWAVRNFTRTYAEWANPFNFNHYHPRYDPHTYTMPIELRGSMLIYIFLLGTMALKTKWRLSFAGFFAAYSLAMGRWDMATFLGGAMISEMDIWASLRDASTMRTDVASHCRRNWILSQCSKMGRWAVFLLALHFLSYPDVGAEFTPGFVFLSSFVPRYYLPLSGWMFYQSMGALLLLPCIIRSSFISRLLGSSVAQYLGRISFSLYLVHGPLLHSLGFWIMPRLFEHFGKALGYLIGWVILFSITIYLAHWWHRRIDVWSTGIGKRLEMAVAA
ncbi:Acyltransferase 3 [Moelleriella libera RCEF 2490]|uniref:Acyltransferase 3 n=1 Tax=Moelleriella libera RCEF 2490 TaxID=1081109 RepID=A0A167WFE8_9HYPO|nr:Acyltransferase 3 [Moelleriella libera RCEF 2490]